MSCPEGMNIVLADTNADSEETESTNGLGKTTLLRIIHFCLGSDFRREKALSHPDLAGVTFYLEFRIEETNYQVSRNTASPKLVSVSKDFVQGLPIDWEPRGDQAVLSVEDRSEERRVGKACVSTCRSRWSAYN